MMTASRIEFIWGAGGVGKSHVALQRAYHAARNKPTCILTLDPSLRLMELQKSIPSSMMSFKTIVLRPEDLFEDFHRSIPAGESVRKLFFEMVRGLQQFREYLQLIQLCEILENQPHQHLIIDTPPFQESGGLLKSMKSLHVFFQQTLVQWALKMTQRGLFQFGARRLFDLTRIFVGKQASESVFDMLEWLSKHTERFQKTTLHLSGLLHSEACRHLLILTPETPDFFLKRTRLNFDKIHNIGFVINRSCWNYPHLDWNDSFSREMRQQKLREESHLRSIGELFPQSQVQRLPLLLMGDDSSEELLQFMRLEALLA